MAERDDSGVQEHARKEDEAQAVQSFFNAIAWQPTPEQDKLARSWISYFAFKMRQANLRLREADMRERLETLGITVKIAQYTGDSSYPTEYALTYGDVSAVGPTLDFALVDFVELLLITLKKTRR